jgi:hypothetical protein
MNTNTDNDNESNAYNKKVNDYLNEIPGRLYVFEITKLCGYSTLIFMYKDETMLDLWNRVSHHFSCHDIKGLYIDSCLNKVNDSSSANNNSNANDSSSTNANNTICNDNNKCSCCSVKTGKYIPVPMSSLKTIRAFVYENISAENRNLVPIYPIPIPVVYRIYLDDGHCHGVN